MLKALLTSIVVPGMALLIAMPAPSFAESKWRAGSHVQRPSAHRSKHYKHVPSHRRHTQHIHHRHDPSHSKYRHHRHKGRHYHRHHHRHERRHHRRHTRRPNVHIGINIGGLIHRPSYPHGHAHHIHDDDCPVVVRPVVVVPTWEVYYHSHYDHSAAAILHVVVGPFSGALYVDGRYYGDTHDLHDGRLELPVAPGLHTVQLRHGGRTFSHKVRVKPGVTAVVKANKI